MLRVKTHLIGANTMLSHTELIQKSILEVLEDMHYELSKDEKDSLIMLYIQSDLLED